MTFEIKSKRVPEIKLEDFQNRSVRNTVQTAIELCDRVMDYVLSAKTGWSLREIENINEWLDKKPQTIGGLLKTPPDRIESLSDAYLTRRGRS